MSHRRTREGEGERRSGSQETGCGDGEASPGMGWHRRWSASESAPAIPSSSRSKPCAPCARPTGCSRRRWRSTSSAGPSRSSAKRRRRCTSSGSSSTMRRDGGREVYGDAAREIAAALDRDERVAFVTLGDPNVYSTFSSLAREVRALPPGRGGRDRPRDHGVPGPRRPGRARRPRRHRVALADHRGRRPRGARRRAHDRARAVVVYKGGRHLPAIAKRLAAAGRLDGAVVGELLGLPASAPAPSTRSPTRPASYLATVIVPPAGRP